MIRTTKKSRSQLTVRFVGSALSGTIATFSFAPYGYWPLIFVSLCGFFLLIHEQKPSNAFKIGLGWGLGQFATGISWVYVVIEKFGGFPLPIGLLLISLLIFYLALFPACFAYLSQKIPVSAPVYYWFYIPALWLSIDWLRGILLTGFPWLWLGYSQIDSPLAAIAPILGVQGITLFIVLIVTSTLYAFKQQKWSALAPAIAILLLCFVLKQKDWTTKTEELVDVAMVQGNVPQELKWLPQYRWPTLLSYQDLTRENWDADIIIWPEAAIPAMEKELPDFLARVDSAAKKNNAAVITGVLDQNSNGLFYNNVISIGDNGTSDYEYPAKERYSKHHLLVFGEFVPFEDFLRPLAPFFNLPMSSFSRGDFQQPNLNAKGYQLATALCYEIAFAGQVRKNLTAQSDFILTLSNDTWFGDSIGPFQHLEIARMRALENGKPVLRATNTGLTAAIDHKGKFIAQIPQFNTQVLRAKITTTKGHTPYTCIGELPLYIWVGLSFVVTIFGYFGFKKRRPVYKLSAFN